MALNGLDFKSHHAPAIDTNELQVRSINTQEIQNKIKTVRDEAILKLSA